MAGKGNDNIEKTNNPFYKVPSFYADVFVVIIWLTTLFEKDSWVIKVIAIIFLGFEVVELPKYFLKKK